MIAAYLWAAPNSALGLLLGLVGLIGGGRMSIHTGVIEIEGPLVAWGLRHLTVLDGGVSAITFGHVVLGCDAATLDGTRAHERVHVRQYERWGPRSSRCISGRRRGRGRLDGIPIGTTCSNARP